MSVETIKNIGPQVPFDPTWLDDNGFLTNIPSPYLHHMRARFQLDGDVISVCGAYPRAERCGVRTQVMEMMTFLVRDDRIIQSLPNGGKAIVSPTEVVVYNKDGERTEAYSLFVVAGRMQWVLTGRLKWQRFEHPDAMPTSLYSFFVAMNGMLREAYHTLHTRFYKRPESAAAATLETFSIFSALLLFDYQGPQWTDRHRTQRYWQEPMTSEEIDLWQRMQHFRAFAQVNTSVKDINSYLTRLDGDTRRCLVAHLKNFHQSRPHTGK